MALRKVNAMPRKREPTIALINVVFLLLVFFLIAGTISPPLDDRLDLVKTEQLQQTPPPEGLVILADETLLKNGEITTIEDIVEDGDTVKIIPDRNLSAAALVEIGRQLRAAGAQSVVIVTEQALQ